MKFDIDSDLSLKQISTEIAAVREKKGKEGQLLALIDKAITLAEDFILNLYLEKALKYQHWYMEERDKVGPKRDVKRMREGLRLMEETIDHALKYVLLNSLDRWQSRICRFYGVVKGYKGNHNQSLEYFNKALKYARQDPEYLEEGVPRYLEAEAFVASATMNSGNLSKGLAMSKELYERFKTGKDGKELKKKNYTVWAIWISGIPIRAATALISAGKLDNKEELESWLNDAQVILNPPKNKTLWADFNFRKAEIAALRRKL